MDDIIKDFGFATDSPKIIKVIGVGGGGGNAVNHMYREGIHDVAFVVCNTDRKALEESPVPVKLQLGHEGLGAGNRPNKAKEATEESIEEVKNMLNDGTKMVSSLQVWEEELVQELHRLLLVSPRKWTSSPWALLPFPSAGRAIRRLTKP